MTRRTTVFLVLAATFVRLIGDGLRLGADPGRFRDGEELLSASAGLFLWHTGWWTHTLDLQYKAFCGGCTVHTLAAAPLLGLGGDDFLLWKGVALGWSVVQVPLAFLALRAVFPGRVGAVASFAALALYAVPPLGATDAGLMAWGNHPESGAFVLAALALAPAPGGSWLRAGLAAGVGVWFCRTTATVLPVLFLLAGRGSGRLALGLVLGGLPLLLPAARGEVGAYDVGLGAASLPALAERAGTLVRPLSLGTRLWPGVRDVAPLAWVWVLVGAAAVGIGGRRQWPVLVLVGSFALAFILADLDLPRRGQRVMNLRYHAPWMLLVPLVVAAAVGVTEGWRRTVSMALLSAMVAANLAGRVMTWAPPLSPIAEPTGGLREFAMVAFRFAPAELSEVRSENPAFEAVARRMEGYALGAAVIRGERSRAEALAGATPEVLAGFGEVLAAADPQATADWLATLPPEPVAALTALRRIPPGDPFFPAQGPLRLPPSLGGAHRPRARAPTAW